MIELQDSIKKLSTVILVKDISYATLYEQLAEECNELAQVCIKKSRYLRKENPPRKTINEINKSLTEEITDIDLVCRLLDIYPDMDIMASKSERWAKILEEANNEDNKSELQDY